MQNALRRPPRPPNTPSKINKTKKQFSLVWFFKKFEKIFVKSKKKKNPTSIKLDPKLFDSQKTTDRETRSGLQKRLCTQKKTTTTTA